MWAVGVVRVGVQGHGGPEEAGQGCMWRACVQSLWFMCVGTGEPGLRVYMHVCMCLCEDRGSLVAKVWLLAGPDAWGMGVLTAPWHGVRSHSGLGQ